MTAASVDRPNAPTYRKLLYKVQGESRKRKQDSIRSLRSASIMLAIGLIVCAALVILAVRFPDTMARFFGVGAFLLGITFVLLPRGLAITGVIKLFSILPSFLRPVRAASCPNCSATHDLFADVSIYVCPICETVIQPGVRGGEKSPLNAVECWYCGRRHAFPAELTGQAVFCQCCGLELSTTASKDRDVANCKTCGMEHPSDTRFCRYCFTSTTGESVPIPVTLVTDFCTGIVGALAGISGKRRDAVERLLLLNPPATLADSRARIVNSDNDTADETQISEYFTSRSLDFALLQLEFVLTDDSLREGAVRAMCSADRVHAKWLNRAHVLLKEGNSLPVALFEAIEKSYVPTRTVVLKRIQELGLEEAIAGFKPVQPLKWRFGRHVQRAKFKDPEIIRNTAEQLAASWAHPPDAGIARSASV